MNSLLLGTFVRLGNDAVDVSGSSIEIVEMTVKGAGDKGISAGENSRVTARKIQIEDADMGVASKGMSRVTLYEPVILRSRIGLTVFQKKSEFGPGFIHVHGDQISDTEFPFLVETGSRLRRGSQEISANIADIDAKLYPPEKGEQDGR